MEQLQPGAVSVWQDKQGKQVRQQLLKSVTVAFFLLLPVATFFPPSLVQRRDGTCESITDQEV